MMKHYTCLRQAQASPLPTKPSPLTRLALVRQSRRNPQQSVCTQEIYGETLPRFRCEAGNELIKTLV